jgi:ribosome biogenesis GTPase A
LNGDLERIVQWYPGHMVRAMRKLRDYLKLVDVVIEAIDARAPRSDANPMLDELVARKERLVVLTREDLADPQTTAAWTDAFAARERRAIAVEARSQQSVARVARALKGLQKDHHRAIVVGLPNSGKSSIINGLVRRAAAKTEDRAGVTRQLRWFRVSDSLELMDTPGILVPKIASSEAQWRLALIGAVPRERYDPEEIAVRFHRWLVEATSGRTSVPSLESFAAARGFARRGGEVDYHNAAQSYIAAFNEGTFGRISLEAPGDEDREAT